MYGQQHQTKVILHKITNIIKKGQKLIEQYQKKSFTICKKWDKRKNVQKQYQSKIPIKEFETISIRSGL